MGPLGAGLRIDDLQLRVWRGRACGAQLRLVEVADRCIAGFGGAVKLHELGVGPARPQCRGVVYWPTDPQPQMRLALAFGVANGLA